MKISARLYQLLYNLNDGVNEKVGFILPDERLVEVANVSDAPTESFDVRGEDILKYIDEAVATWHTHPSSSSNLSIGDYETFLAYPNHRHFISGSDGVTQYYVEDGEVLINA